MLAHEEETMSGQRSKIQVHPTAQIHPSAILEGNVTIGAYSRIGAGTVITGNATIGHHTLVECNTVIRGTNTIGNYCHIYDLVCIEGGRPAQVGGSAAEERDRSVIGDGCWINHGATMHGSQLKDGAVLDLNACLDYNCHIGKGAIVANGSACRLNTVIPDNCLAQGVPAKVVQKGLTDDDRLELMGVLPSAWTRYWAEGQEERINSAS
jgi:UDP-N-acetylglucosamine acyltransferase